LDTVDVVFGGDGWESWDSWEFPTKVAPPSVYAACGTHAERMSSISSALKAHGNGLYWHVQVV
jgi:hypothetical protein